MAEDEPACGGIIKAGNVADLGKCARSARAALVAVPAMKTTPLARSTQIPKYSGATIAVKSAGYLWFGSFVSDRLAYVLRDPLEITATVAA